MKGLVHVVVICDNYFCTRVCTAIIRFVDTPVGPSSEEDEEVFAELEELIHGDELSRAIGWAIQLGQRLPSCRQNILDIKEKLRGVELEKNPELGMMLFFVKQVCKCTCMYLYNMTMHIMFHYGYMLLCVAGVLVI